MIQRPKNFKVVGIILMLLTDMAWGKWQIGQILDIYDLREMTNWADLGDISWQGQSHTSG